MGANLALELPAGGSFLLGGDLILALPFALIGFYGLIGVLRGIPLRVAWVVQAILTVLAFHEDAGSASSTSALVFVVPLVVGPVVATVLMIGSTFVRAAHSWRTGEPTE